MTATCGTRRAWWAAWPLVRVRTFDDGFGYLRPSPGERLRQLLPQPAAAPRERPEFPEIFGRYSAYVWTALRRLGAEQRDLEDLTHDVFVSVFRHLSEYDPSRPIKPWLFAFAFRVASDSRRRMRRRPEVIGEPADARDPSPSAVEQLLARERRELAWAALETLELGRRAVFVLHELDGYSIPEVAASLGMPLATAYSRLRLARQDFDRAASRLRSRHR
jgi:RNA polymerase sigma-70 factor (ECF subfamily)